MEATSKQSVRIYNANWRNKNREHLRAYTKAWQQKNKEHLKSYFKSYYQEHKALIKSRAKSNAQKMGKSYQTQKHRNWRKRNPEKWKASARRAKLKFPKERLALLASKRRALMRQASVNLKGINDYVRKIKSKPFVVCYYCKVKIRDGNFHFDHIIPLSKGGSHSVDNLCTACPRCNLTKWAKLISDVKAFGQQILAI